MRQATRGGGHYPVQATTTQSVLGQVVSAIFLRQHARTRIVRYQGDTADFAMLRQYRLHVLDHGLCQRAALGGTEQPGQA